MGDHPKNRHAKGGLVAKEHVDGKVWTQNNGFAGVHRLDLATGKIETWEPQEPRSSTGVGLVDTIGVDDRS